jgi:hypothetical protein
MKTTYQYIEFQEASRPPQYKTRLWKCRNRKRTNTLGVVYWEPSRSQYLYEPEAGCILNAECLHDLSDFISQAMDEHKKGIEALSVGVPIGDIPTPKHVIYPTLPE